MARFKGDALAGCQCRNVNVLSVATFVELRTGVDLMNHGRRRTSLTSWLETDLLRRFEGRVLPVTASIADECGKLIASCKRSGFHADSMDALVGATARVHNMAVVTLNRKHFMHFDVTLVDF